MLHFGLILIYNGHRWIEEVSLVLFESWKINWVAKNEGKSILSVKSVNLVLTKSVNSVIAWKASFSFFNEPFLNKKNLIYSKFCFREIFQKING